MSRDRRSQSKELQFARTTTIKWEIPPPFCVICRIELIKKSAIGPSLKAARWLLHVTWNITHHISSDVKKKKMTAQRKRAHLLHTNQTEMKEAFISLFVVSHFSKMSNVCPFISCQAAAFHVSMQVSLSLWGETQYFRFLTVTVSAFHVARVSLEKCRTLCAIFLLCKASVLLAAKCVLILIVWSVWAHWSSPFSLQLSFFLNLCQSN